ncbi:hypothetical protein [Teredinibacter franksiae]|uniref:hypothetical protein n=1 Tax=Teredinibacter franksiae TaxID=2761453 RepID=UPI00162585A5|nr:hypothetical protein [Teredinibacter franksiae]
MSALMCRVELNKTDGITITLDNENGNITHTVVLNGDSITTTSKGASDTSTITQAPDKISMNCKTFELTAETISCSANNTVALNSGSDFSIKSDANLNAEAATGASFKAADIGIEGTNIELSGSAQISATGGIIKLQ